MILKRKETNKRGAAASVCGWTGTRQTARCGRGSDKQNLQRVSVSRLQWQHATCLFKGKRDLFGTKASGCEAAGHVSPKDVLVSSARRVLDIWARQQRPEWLLHAGTTLLTRGISLCPSSSLAESHYSIFPFISTLFPFISVCVSLKSL